ncbi:MAG: hypothetical protein ACEY3M_19635 [Wolbachia sp.]
MSSKNLSVRTLSTRRVSSQSGIQVAHKQTSIENGYNVFDEIAGRLDSSVWALPSWMKRLDSRLE